LDKKQSLTGRVVWNKKNENGFEIGLKFDDPNELFRLRMIEQICHIQHYRAEVKQHEGRELSSEEAAKEWISLYASNFPELKDG
ncbi:MAG: PilZ domain-containing protein, partial [Gammaproteobacteria bacterium]|nr:PilZ domain-containing protein [Gammaproteobacteria bacterium]